MRDLEILMNPNKLVKHLKKPAREFTKYDIIKFIDDHQIEMLNFRYVGEDGKLKTLNFVITSKDYLESILSTGERVDGSSLFSYIEADYSDLYVIPKFRTAFVNPFTEHPTLDILCSFYIKGGQPLESSPEYILKKASNQFTKDTGYTFKAMGELEYYVISEKNELYPSKDQRGYHEASPFANWENLRTEALLTIAQCGGKIKYGHTEVGNFTTETHMYEQQEIEFTPVDAEEAVEQLIVSKWILRMLGQKYGVTISFAPKITVGKAGSGLHIHMMLEKDGINYMNDDVGLTDIAKKHNVSIEDITNEFKKGYKVEREHTTDSDVAKEIAMDHLFEDPKYYDKLAKIEEGTTGSLTFLANPKYQNFIYSTQATITIVNKSFEPEQEVTTTLIKVEDAYKSFSKLLEYYNQIKINKFGIEQPSFISENVAHPQYISGNNQKNELGSLDFLYNHLISEVFNDKIYFDFGPSNEENGQKINEGILFWKESFGARSTVQSFYEVKTSNYSLLENIMI